MITKDDILNYIQRRQERIKDERFSKPIFQIFLFENADKELIYENDGKKKNSGFPDTGCIGDFGFYYDIDQAIEALNTNAADIHECVYDAGFILVKFPGLYDSCSSSERMYFRWDSEKEGFFEAEEPEIFSHVAY